MDELEENESEQEEEGDQDDSQISLQVTLSADNGGFFRRTCPKCGLDFKTEVEDAQFSWLLAEEVRRQDPNAGVNDKEATESSFFCPYCESLFSWKESFTEETVDYAKLTIRRDYVLPMIDRIFGDLEKNNSRVPKSGGLISFSVSFTHERSPRPPRPFHGPEPPDMNVVRFLCCDKKAKILDGFLAVSSCIYCQTPVALSL